jgi:hypothetical protein
MYKNPFNPFNPFNISIADLYIIIYRLQSNSCLITFKDANPLARHLKCKKV